MSWMKRLSEVYENNIEKIGVFESCGGGQSFTLLPISHVTQSAQIEVILDRNGNFFRAVVVPKEKARTIVPATIDSANRAGAKVAAHYLHDKLFYVSGDYMKYGGEGKRSENYSQYINQLKEWVDSEFNHPKVELIYQYVRKGTLIEDLISVGILYVDKDGKLIEKWTGKSEDKPELYKVVAGKSSEAFVRFNILRERSDEVPVWEDRDLFERFQNYLAYKMEHEARVGICYVTGQSIPLTESHGTGIRNAGDRSKLISSNHNKNKHEFIYMGRFNHPNQAVQISYDVSQKAHNALRWLNQRQGYRSDTRHFITFGIKNPEAVLPFKSTAELYYDPMGVLTGKKMVEEKKDYTKLVMAEQVQQAIKGKKHNFNIDGGDQIIIMAIDAATRGRLAIVYYQELESNLFLENLTFWHNSCKWMQHYFDKINKKWIQYIGTPSTYQIVESVYGLNADEKVKKELYTRLLPCIVDRAAIPKDIVRSIFNRVKNPMSFKDDQTSNATNWQRTLNIACALIRKQYEMEEIDMTLDTSSTDRDYLFGRLLGVAEVLERNELKRRDEKRATNAMRYFNAFSQRPARTWMTIRRQLHPYQVRPTEQTGYYNKIIQEIESTIKSEDMNNNALGPLFLLGYSSQIQDFYTKKEQKEEKKNDTN